MPSEIEKTVRAFIESSFLYGKDIQSFSDEDSLLGIGLIDSMGILELVAFLQHTYGFQVADTELVPQNLDSVRQIGAYVRRKTGKDHPEEAVPTGASGDAR